MLQNSSIKQSLEITRVVAVWRDLVRREKASGGLVIAQRGREFHEQVPSSWGSVFRGSGGFAKSKGRANPHWSRLGYLALIQRFHPHFRRLAGEGAHAATVKRLNFAVSGPNAKRSSRVEVKGRVSNPARLRHERSTELTPRAQPSGWSGQQSFCRWSKVEFLGVRNGLKQTYVQRSSNAGSFAWEIQAR